MKHNIGYSRWDSTTERYVRGVNVTKVQRVFEEILFWVGVGLITALVIGCIGMVSVFTGVIVAAFG